MRLAILALMLILLSGLASAECTDALDGMIIKEDTTFCSDSYDVFNGIKIDADNIVLDCGTAVLRGNMQEGTAITIENRKNVTIANCNIVTFHVGIYILNSSFITFEDSALLKNRIGIRMMNAFENKLVKIADKSTQTPLSIINSKFNLFDINKRIDEDYCDDNLCEGEKDYNPCVDDDFYCSLRCNKENDKDCIKKEVIKYKKPPAVNETKENKTIEPEPQPEKMTLKPKKKSKGWLLYIVFYIFAFFIIRFYEHVTID